MLAGVPVVQQARGDEEGVVLVAALAVVPAAVVADLGLSSGESDRTLAACGGGEPGDLSVRVRADWSSTSSLLPHPPSPAAQHSLTTSTLSEPV